MNIIPSIDIHENKCVRLTQGKFEKLTTYNVTPKAIAKSYQEQGVEYLHIVNLSGAQSYAHEQQWQAILELQQYVPLKLQVGGGLREKNEIEFLLNSGIQRVVLGSMACQQPDLVKTLIEQYCIERIILAFDVNIKKEPLLAIHGWQETLEVTLWRQLEVYQEFNKLRILCTDIAADGMLSGPNISLYRQCRRRYPNFHYQSSGGVNQLQDLLHLKELGVADVIIGKALYEIHFTFAQALEVAKC